MDLFVELPDGTTKLVPVSFTNLALGYDGSG